ncbi:MAG TPA: Trp family transcriptional regulator, partial [Candidatus Paceibacterota bacterium]
MILNADKEKYTEELVGVVQRVSNDKELLRAFLQDILSPTEYKELGIRWQIVKQLAQGKSHRDVAKNLHTGVATVTRGSRAL